MQCCNENEEFVLHNYKIKLYYCHIQSAELIKTTQKLWYAIKHFYEAWIANKLSINTECNLFRHRPLRAP